MFCGVPALVCNSFHYKNIFIDTALSQLLVANGPRVYSTVCLCACRGKEVF